ncbi:hypothetical protein AB0M20_38805 [Actinoplanes sp. NPDC051633]|uniref:hypothetical protein n=1 Tax=Actinoplanes sp. NPDC051633 TaxID=3155670 RepID=UPI0034290B08
MSNELERAFAALSADAGYVLLEPASAIRKAGDRRTATRAAAGVAAGVVALAGVSIGAHAVLADPDRTTPVPADSPAPTPSTQFGIPPVKGEPPRRSGDATPGESPKSNVPPGAEAVVPPPPVQ